MIEHALLREIDLAVNHLGNKHGFGIRHGQYVDMSNYYIRQGNLAYVDKTNDGVILFPMEIASPKVHHIHFAFIPGTPAKDILRSTRAMLARMFDCQSAAEIRGYPPLKHRAVRMLGAHLGFERNAEYSARDSFGRELAEYRLGADQWAAL